MFTALPSTMGEQIALDPFAGNVGGTLLRTAGELVDFVNEHDAHLLHALTGEIGDLVLVHELGGLVLDEMTPRRADLHLLAVRLLREQLAERALHLIAELFHAGHAQHTDGLRLFLHLELDLAVIKESLPEKLAQLLTGVLPAVAGGQKQIEQALLSGGFGTPLTFSASSARTRLMPISIRSRIMDSTSRPT